MAEWIEVVSDTNREEAKKKFEIWKKENTAISTKLSENDIRIDTIRTLDKKNITRYCIKNVFT